MLAESPEHRPGSAMAFARALTQALTGESAEAFVRTPPGPAAPSPDEALRLFATQGTLWQAPTNDDPWREPALDRRVDSIDDEAIDPLPSDSLVSTPTRMMADDTLVATVHDDTVIHALAPGLRSDHRSAMDRLPEPIDEPEVPVFVRDEDSRVAGVGGLFGRSAAPAVEPPAEASAPAGVVLALTLALGLAVGGAGGFLLGQRSASRAQEQAGADAPIDEPRLASDPAASTPPAAAEPAPVVPEASPAAPAANAPAARSRAAVSSGELIVRSTPARAAVVVDNVWRGRTPLTLRGLAFGTHTVRVVEKGYAPETRRVSLDGRVPAATVSVQLERAAPERAAARPAPAPGATTGSLYIESRPTGARVTVDGRLVGTTPLLIGDLAPGGRAIRLEHPGHRPWTTTVQITAGRRQRLAASLEEGPQ
jgi:hypothetical protein